MMWFQKCGCFLITIVLVQIFCLGRCNAISNTQFNASIREYAVAEDDNSTGVRTLQKELIERYAHLAPVSNTIRLKEVPDSVLSPSSTHGRGLLHLNHHGYTLADHDESPYHGYVYEYHIPEDHHSHYDTHDYHHNHDHHHGYDHDQHAHDHDGHDHGHHGHVEHYDHHLIHHDDHKHGHGHHFKHYDHALAAKTVLWPIAGIALLGAAAALVSNPVLLQLGVVSGRRKRRDTEEIVDRKDVFIKKKLADEFILRNLKNFNNATSNPNGSKRMGKRGMLLNKAMNNKHKLLLRDVKPTVKAAIQSASNKPENNGVSLDKQYIPIPLMIKDIGGN